MEIRLDPNSTPHEPGDPVLQFQTLPQLNDWLRDRPPGGHRVLFKSGATFPGMVVIPGGDPDNPILLSTDGEKPFTIRSGPGEGAVSARGAGGWHLHGLWGVGDGASRVIGIELAAPSDGDCRNVRAENCGATGYGLVGLALWSYGGRMFDLRVKGGLYTQNAVGVLVGSVDESYPEGRHVFGVELIGVEASDNDWLPAEGMAGFGMALNATDGLTVQSCVTNRNGLKSWVGGHAGVMAYCCSNVRILDHEAHDNADPNPEHGDGQGAVLDDVTDALVARGRFTGNNTGVYVMSESRGHGTRNVVVRNCFVDGNVTGIGAFAECASVLFFDNDVTADGFRRGYKAVDLCRSGAFPFDVRVIGNRVRALNGALALEAANGLEGARFDSVFSGAGVYRVAGRDYPTLGDAQRAEADPVSFAQGRAVRPYSATQTPSAVGRNLNSGLAARRKGRTE